MDDATHHDRIQQLGAAMSDVSEACYCAGWLGGTEDVLPELCRRAIETGQAQRWGHGEVTPEAARNLWAMAERAGAWADLHPQDDRYVPYQPFPLRPGVAEEVDREQLPRLHSRTGGAGPSVERWTIAEPHAGRFRLHINFGGRGFWCMFDYAVAPAPARTVSKSWPVPTLTRKPSDGFQT